MDEELRGGLVIRIGDRVVDSSIRTSLDQTAILTNYVPGALLMGYIAAMIGETYSRGCKDNWAFADHGAGIKNSQMILD